MSIEAFPEPVEAISFSFGSRSRTSRGRGVRSRMTHTTSKGCSRATTASGSPMVGEHRDLRLTFDSRPIRHRQRDVLVVVEDRYLHHIKFRSGSRTRRRLRDIGPVIPFERVASGWAIYAI